MVTLYSSEVEALGRNIGQEESLLKEHNARTHESAARLLFHQLSAEDTGRYRHLELSRW